jgi:DNA-binding response OmpR family regulator
VSPVIEPSRCDHGNIMIVDDNPANLKLLEDMLRQHGYEVRSFPRGRLALAGADQDPPDLILLDINMPELNGYEVCEQLKASDRLSVIPVIFLSALNATEDKVKGFRSGGVDYISKPFQFEEVQARVETQVKLRRAQQAEHDLLEKTLRGAVETLWELVQLSSPALALRSRAIQDIVLRITQRVEIRDAWQHELAATLCFVGCMAVPDQVFERAYPELQKQTRYSA